MSESTIRLLDVLQRMSETATLHWNLEHQLVAAMLTGGDGITLLGKPVRFQLEWPEGPPPGWTDDGLRQFGEELKARAPR